MARAVASIGVAVATVCFTTACFTVCLTVGASLAHAQRVTTVGMSAQGTSITLDNYARASVGTLSGIFAVDADRWQAQTAVAASRFETGHSTTFGTLAATLDVLRTGPWRASWSGDVGTGAFRGDASGQYARTWGRLAYAMPFFNLWTVGSLGRVSDVSTRQVRRAELGIGSGYGVAAGFVTGSYGTVGHTWYRDVELHGALRSARLDLDVSGGHRFGATFNGGATWHAANATVTVRDPFAIVASGGYEPADPERALLGAHFVSLGVRVQRTFRAAPSPVLNAPIHGPRFRVSDVQADGSRRIIIRLDQATRVDVMGDFTDWEAVPMQRTSEHGWTVALPITPGAHRINIRIDGGDWQVPPDVPAQPDDFGGMAGVIAVE